MHRLRLLGPPDVVHRGGDPVSLSMGKPLALLVYVACHRSPVSRDDLADLLWPETERQKGRHSVRQALWVLKNAFGEDLFETHDPLALRPDVLDVDVHAFTTALSEGRIEDARSLWRGPVLEHFVLAGVRRWNHWAEDLRADLERRFCRALLRHAHALRNQGNPGEAVAALEQAIEVSPTAEAPHLARIELFLDLLRLDGAREALADARSLLGDHSESLPRLAATEERLNQVIREQQARVAEGNSFPMEFVGRSRELAVLHGLWREADLGRTRIGIITGPSGIGKTRLAQELLSYVSGEETSTASVRGTRGEMRLRWGVASELVRQLIRLPGSAGISSASDSLLRAMLPSLGKGEVNLQTVNGVSPAAILDAVTDLLESVAFETPLVVLVDDVQWLDPESRTLFMGLANRCRNLRVLFLVLGRTDLSSRHWEQVESTLLSEAGARRVLLKPLIEEEVGELLALGAAFPEPREASGVVHRIHQASAGNPLFLREILKELHEQGILRREGPGWVFRTNRIPDELGLPENIRSLLRERLERLSEPGTIVAGSLARADRGVSAERLQLMTQLHPSVFTQAVAELIERGVIEWINGTRLDFVHDLLREAASVHLEGSLPSPPGSGFRRPLALGLAVLAAGLLLALPIGVLWGGSGAPWASEAQEPPYGGGHLVFRRKGLHPFFFRPSGASPERWPPSAFEPRPPPGASHVFRSPGGGFLWFGQEDTPQGPNMVRILSDGARLPLFPEPGDQALYDFFPDGSRILFVSENTERAPFSHTLLQGWLDTGKADTLYEGQGPVAHARWSRDGDLVAFAAVAARDTLVVTSTFGERIGAAALGDVSGLSWCGPDVVAASGSGEEAYFLRFQIPGMVVDTLARIEPEARPTCSPNGQALAYLGVLDRRLTPLLLDLESGEVHSLPRVDGQVYGPRWFAEAPPPIPRRIRASADTVRLTPGEAVPVSATVRYSDGSESREGIRWESLDPAVAAVGPEDRLTGNGPGRTRVLACLGYSLTDTILVEVTDEGRTGVLFRDSFETLDTLHWIRVGSRPPAMRRLDGLPVLRILGDEKYTDGLLLRSPLPVQQGLTLELEFKIDLNRAVHQNLAICLREMELSDLDAETGVMDYDAEACVQYPAREHHKLDSSEALVRTGPGRTRTLRIPGVLPSEDWVHMALQLRADGEASLVLDRQPVGSSPVTLQMDDAGSWFLLIQGDAVGTEAYVRNLAVWPGERYGPESEP